MGNTWASIREVSNSNIRDFNQGLARKVCVTQFQNELVSSPNTSPLFKSRNIREPQWTGQQETHLMLLF